MTMPHMMNCSHCGDGWCLSCVGKLYWGFEVTRKALSIALDRSWDGPLPDSVRSNIARVLGQPYPVSDSNLRHID